MWPERIGGKELMFLWSLEVEFPHPINCNTEAENDSTRSENILKVLNEKEIMSRTPQAIKDNNIDDNKDVDDDDDDNNGDGDGNDDAYVGHVGNGNTTSGGDMNSIENRLLISSGTQLREEMYGIEKRQKVIVLIDAPIYYETFRECHRVEWKSINQNDELLS